jgi:hypothetical protein
MYGVAREQAATKKANFPDNSIMAACINQTTAQNKFHPRLRISLRFFSALWVNEKCVVFLFLQPRDIFFRGNLFIAVLSLSAQRVDCNIIKTASPLQRCGCTYAAFNRRDAPGPIFPNENISLMRIETLLARKRGKEDGCLAGCRGAGGCKNFWMLKICVCDRHWLLLLSLSRMGGRIRASSERVGL